MDKTTPFPSITNPVFKYCKYRLRKDQPKDMRSNPVENE